MVRRMRLKGAFEDGLLYYTGCWRNAQDSRNEREIASDCEDGRLQSCGQGRPSHKDETYD